MLFAARCANTLLRPVARHPVRGNHENFLQSANNIVSQFRNVSTVAVENAEIRSLNKRVQELEEVVSLGKCLVVFGVNLAALGAISSQTRCISPTARDIWGFA